MHKPALIAATGFGALLIAAAPAPHPSAAPPPIANYWMDVSTVSGFGAGMMGAMGSGGRPGMGAIMGMMRGGGSVAHMLNLRLSSRQRPAGAPQADHFIPAGMQMGPSLPLVSPEVAHATQGEPGSYEKPKGRILIYWGCGEHAAAPLVIDLAKVASGQIPPGVEAMARMGRAMGRTAERLPRPENSAAYGEWPNRQDARTVPASGSLLGAHRIQANYAPAIAFSLTPGQDFMPGLGLHEAGATPAGATRLDWTPASQATGYALALFGQGQGGDTVMWTSGRSAADMPAFDYLTPVEVRRMVAAGSALAPSAAECLLPAEVSRAVPQGMVMMIGYGPEAYFADKPKAPTWTTRVRFKTTAMLIRGMGGMGQGMDEGADPGDDQGDQAQQQEQQRPKKRRGLGGILGNLPVPH